MKRENDQRRSDIKVETTNLETCQIFKVCKFCILYFNTVSGIYNLQDNQYVILRMIKPLTLIPRHNEQDLHLSPSHRKRADSLVFSITSEKHFSPYDTNLLDSRQDEVSRELQSLQYKINSLQSKVQFIDPDRFLTETQDRSLNIKIKQESRYSINYLEIEPHEGQENSSIFANQPGKIVRKGKDISKQSKISKIDRRQFNKKSKDQMKNSFEGSRNSSAARELMKLKKKMSSMKQSIEKTQRSKSLCSERLSASKSLIKNLKKEQKRNEKLIAKLRGEVKRSQNIREKQKQIILRQQQQISHYRQLLKLSKPIR